MYGLVDTVYLPVEAVTENLSSFSIFQKFFVFRELFKWVMQIFPFRGDLREEFLEDMIELVEFLAVVGVELIGRVSDAWVIGSRHTDIPESWEFYFDDCEPIL